MAMEIVKEISVTLSPIEVKEIIKQYLKQEKGIDIKAEGDQVPKDSASPEVSASS